jgi:hypothetical protein
MKNRALVAAHRLHASPPGLAVPASACRQLDPWQQARLDAWQDDGIRPSDFENEYPEPQGESQ